MLTPREVAANRFLALGGMPVHVTGFVPDDYVRMRQHRVERLRGALAALRAAVGTSRTVPGEWDDLELEQAARQVERQLLEGAAPSSPAVAATQPRTTSL